MVSGALGWNLQIVKDAEPVTSPVAYAGMTNLRRLYEDIPMPAGLAVVGDSLAGFNPVLAPCRPISFYCVLHMSHTYTLHMYVKKGGDQILPAMSLTCGLNIVK